MYIICYERRTDRPTDDRFERPVGGNDTGKELKWLGNEHNRERGYRERKANELANSDPLDGVRGERRDNEGGTDCPE